MRSALRWGATPVTAGLAAAKKTVEFKPDLTALLAATLLKSIGGDTQAVVGVLAKAQAEAPENKDVRAGMRTVRAEPAGRLAEALKATWNDEELRKNKGLRAEARNTPPPRERWRR